jgi:hypothetical protein
MRQTLLLHELLQTPPWSVTQTLHWHKPPPPPPVCHNASTALVKHPQELLNLKIRPTSSSILCCNTNLVEDQDPTLVCDCHSNSPGLLGV